MQKDGTPNATDMPEPTTGKALSPDSPFAGEKTIELVFDPVVPLPPAAETSVPAAETSVPAAGAPLPPDAPPAAEPTIEATIEPKAEAKIDAKNEPENELENELEDDLTNELKSELEIEHPSKVEAEVKPEPTPAPKPEPVLKSAPRPGATPAKIAPAPLPPLAKPPGAKRQIWLCADDFGISPGVNEAICELLLRSHINATSVMTVAPSFTRAETMPLSILQAGSQHMAIGLHVTLTAPFKPLSRDYGPLRDGAFLPLKPMLRAALLRRLKPQIIAIEVGAQIKAFTAAFGRPPDFIDGHQHVHIFPQVRDAVVAAVRHAAPNAWLRHCGSSLSFWKLFSDRKGLLIDHLSGGLQKRTHAAGLKTNPAFAGTYDFKPSSDYAALFPGFLRGLPDGSVVMCHPGRVDEQLRRLDTLTDLREKEYAFFANDDFPRLLEREGVTLD